MNRTARFLALSSFGGFFSITLWRVILQGVMEKPSLEVSHLDAGAGDSGLIVQFFTAILAIGFAVFWFLTQSRSIQRIAPLLMAVIVPVLFLACARGLQRFAPKYSEAGFQRLIAAHQTGRALYATDVLSVLGEPLIQKTNAAGGETWLYSYMPSCGFGWDKKYVGVDGAGRITDIFTVTEP